MIADLPTPALVAIGALILVQLSLQVMALVSLAKTSPDRVTLGGKKWLWAVIILLGEMIGAIVWFIAGRTPAPAMESASGGPTVDRARTAADALYGTPGDASARKSGAQGPDSGGRS